MQPGQCPTQKGDTARVVHRTVLAVIFCISQAVRCEASPIVAHYIDNLPVYVSPALAEDERITFNAGSHEDAIRMSYREFEHLVQPQVVPMAKHD